MRADKDFKTYEQALIVVQRFGDLAEEDHKRGEHQQALYNLSHATFVGVKHLLFMAADAAVDRSEARELAAKNHLATVELISLAIASLKDSDAAITDFPPSKDKKSAGAVRRNNIGRKAIKAQKVRTGPGASGRTSARKMSSRGAAEKGRGPRGRQR